MSKIREVDVLIVGGGIAGLTAAIYAGRAGQSTVVIEGDYKSSADQPGGQLMLTSDIENFPGYEGGSGMKLIATTKKQAEKSGAEIIDFDEVIDYELNYENSGRHYAETQEGEKFVAKSLILATGSIARRLGVTGEDEGFGKGVSSCATCDGSFFAGEDVAVIGGGDTAVEEALYLSNIAKSVTLVHRRDTLRTESPESEMLMRKDNINVIWSNEVEEIKLADDGKVNSVSLVSTKDENVKQSINVKGLFVAIGHDPSVSHLKKTIVALSNDNYILTDGVKTNVKGVFAAGDVADPIYRQAVVAAATGACSAMDAIEHNRSF